MDTDERRYRLVTDRAARGAVYEGHGPQAVYDEESNATIVVYRGDDADPFATWFDHDAGTIGPQTRIGTNPLSNDDNHGPPSLCIDDDGFLYAFYGSHSSDHHLAKSTEPRDPTSWEERGPLTDVPPGTYPMPLLYDGDLYVCYRSGDRYDSTYPAVQYATIVRSTDGGASFEDLGPIIDTTGHPAERSVAYVKDVAERDGRFHVSWFVAHANGTEMSDYTRSNVFHACFDPADGRIYGVDGTAFGSTIDWQDMQHPTIRAFDGDDANHPKHVLTDDGVAILYTHFDPDRDEIRWQVTTWDGAGWRTEQVGDAVANHLFDGGYPRVTDDGDLEVHVVTGDGSETRRYGPGRGGDFAVYRKRADGAWTRYPIASADRERRFSRVTVVANGRDEFASLFAEASDDPEDFAVSLYAADLTGFEE